MGIGGIYGGFNSYDYGVGYNAVNNFSYASVNTSGYGIDTASRTDPKLADEVYGSDSSITKQAEKESTVDKDGNQKKAGYDSSPEECETCKNRKYQDGSDEMVSFKAAGHIDPSNAASVVLGHEQEHVSNAYNKAKNNNGEVESATVSLKTAICPECGRSYISGGETNTQIKYYNEDNPYQQDLKSADASKYRGANVDIVA